MVKELQERYRAIVTAGFLDGDPYDDVKDYIELLETEAYRLQEALDAKETVNRLYMTTLDLMGIDKRDLIDRIALLAAERDAAVADIKAMSTLKLYGAPCEFCKNASKEDDLYCIDCDRFENFEWRGPQGVGTKDGPCEVCDKLAKPQCTKESRAAYPYGAGAEGSEE